MSGGPVSGVTVRGLLVFWMSKVALAPVPLPDPHPAPGPPPVPFVFTAAQPEWIELSLPGYPCVSGVGVPAGPLLGYWSRPNSA